MDIMRLMGLSVLTVVIVAQVIIGGLSRLIVPEVAELVSIVGNLFLSRVSLSLLKCGWELCLLFLKKKRGA